MKNNFFLNPIADVEIFSHPNYLCGKGKTYLDVSLESSLRQNETGLYVSFCPNYSVHITDFQLENEMFLSKPQLFLRVTSNLSDGDGNIVGNIQIIVDKFKVKNIRDNVVIGEMDNSYSAKTYKTMYQ